ncbi:MAG: nucleotidyl transferase AbiEii/AbiGii toxin family protein [Candidatus Altiarchaeota archaeon]
MKEFFDALYGMKAVERRDLLEKDYHLHRILVEMNQDPWVSERIVFKGGTCLIKAYLGYFRFSEDLDFTWANQEDWSGKTPSAVRKACSKHITEFGEHLEEICGRLDLKFKSSKEEKTAIEIGGGGRLVRFYPRFTSQQEGLTIRLKVEINFLEKILYPTKQLPLKTYLTELLKKDAEVLGFRYPQDYKAYAQKVKLNCYNPKEIYAEKCRAALTRQAFKLRDYLDILALEDKYGYSIPEYAGEIAEKTEYMLRLYKKYRENIRLPTTPTGNQFKTEENKLLLKPIPHKIPIDEEIARINKQLADIPQLTKYLDALTYSLKEEIKE